MNILMLSKDFEKNGLTTCVVDYSRCMTQKGHRVWICCADGEERPKLAPGVQWINLDLYTKRPDVILKNITALRRLLRTEKIDIIHCHWRKTTLYAQVLHMLTGVDFIWQNHLYPIPHDPIHRALTFYGKRAVALAAEGYDFLTGEMRIPGEKISIINNGIDLAAYGRVSDEACAELKRKWNIPENAKTIVLFGRLAEQKGHRFLLDAVKDLGGEYRVIFTGEGPAAYKEGLCARIDELGLREKIIFTGNVTPNEILSVCDVMALPSVSEGFAITVLEAMAFQIPVVRTKVGGYKDMADCVDGVDYGDTKTLTALLEKNLACGPEVRERVRHAYEVLQAKWTLDKVVDQYLELYRA